MKINLQELEVKFPIVRDLAQEKEVAWINPDKTSMEEARKAMELSMKDVDDAEARLERFAPFIMKCFPETKDKKRNYRVCTYTDSQNAEKNQ